MGNVAARQAEYALKPAESKSDLEYEEMHKLFSLCDEIYALDFLGLPLDVSLRRRFEQGVMRRFERERQKARNVAADKYEWWKEGIWWYDENLKSV